MNWRLIFLGLLVILVDRVSKTFALRLGFVKNYGIVLGLFASNSFIARVVFIVLSLIVLFVLFYVFRSEEIRKSKLLQYGLLFLMAGLLSNLLDRIFYGYIIDFIRVTSATLPAFNFADVSCSFGAVLCLVWLFMQGR